MSIGKLLYDGLPKFISAVKHLASTSNIHSRGLSFKLISDNWITKYRARSFNDKEPEMLNWLDEHLCDGDIFFDVGANVGIYSIYAALRNSEVTVYAFEPEYSNLHQLKENILNNKLAKNIFSYSVALDDNSGISYLHIQDKTPGAALATVSNNNLKETTTGHSVIWKEGIAVMTIDAFCIATGVQPSILKMDVDGNELSILKGGEKTFNNSRLRTVYIEVDKNQVGCEKILTKYGFVLADKLSENQIWKRS